MKYNIRLTIAHFYDHSAVNSRHLIRVQPRTLAGRQTCYAGLMEISPEPEFQSEGVDFFGNATHSCTHRDAHSQMSIHLSCQVAMTPPVLWRDVSVDVKRLRIACDSVTDLGPNSPVHFCGPSPRLPPNKSICAFAQDLFDAQASAAENVIRIGKGLHDAMIFDASATTVDTNAADAFRLRRGVCQDFTHIMILALQSLDIPAGYVSGYLRTLPPPGGVKLEGADAMHAWVRAWCGPQQGWIEYDPTNATLVGTDHIVVGFGRDYSDVSPVRGHLRSAGGQRNTQAVDVAIIS